MFTTILGIPAHPLLIHAAVVFIPLLTVGTIVYAVWPAVRDRITWAVLGLAVIAPFAAWFAKLSGDAFRRRLIAKHLASPQVLAKITVHQSYGNHTFWWTIALGLATLAMIGYVWRYQPTPPNRVITIGTAAVVIVLGVVTGYYVFRTGDTGAHIAWQGY